MAVGALVLAVACIAQLVRSSGTELYEVIWAEDGRIFLTDAMNQGLGVIVEPATGYLQIAPRVSAEAVARLPVEAMALGLAVISSLAVAALALYVYWASGPVIRPAWARALLAFAFCLTPVGGWDMTANISHLQFFLLYAAFWALVVPRASRAEALAATGIVVLTALSTPLAALLVPLALAIPLRTRARLAWAAPAGLALGLVAQLPVLDASARSGELGASLPQLFAERVAGAMLASERYVTAAVRASDAFAWLALALVAAACLAVVWRARPARFVSAAAVALSVAFFCVAVLSRRPEEFSAAFGVAGTRYTYLPVMLLITVLVIGAAHFPNIVARTAVVALIAALVVTEYRMVPTRANGPHWRSGVEAARAQCRDNSALQAATVPVWSATPGWAATVRCERL